MGFPPSEVDRMSQWQFFAAMDGWMKANGSGGDGHLSQVEKDEIWEWMQTKESAALADRVVMN